MPKTIQRRTNRLNWGKQPSGGDCWDRYADYCNWLGKNNLGRNMDHPMIAKGKGSFDKGEIDIRRVERQ